MKTIRHLPILVLVVLLGGCFPSQTANPDSLPALSATQSSMPVSTAAAPAAIESPDSHLNIDCLPIHAAKPANLTSRGILVLESRAMGNSGRYLNLDTYFMDMTQGTATQVARPHENVDAFAVSPDQKWIAYTSSILEGNDLVLHLVLATGEDPVYKVLPWEPAWQSYRWIDNQHLVIVANNQANRGVFASFNSISFLLLNPFTDQRAVPFSKFPNVYDVYPMPYWDGPPEVAYGPMAMQAVYLKGSVSGPYYYVLWNTQEGTEVTSVPVIGDLRAVPRWSPDGSGFALAPSLLSKQGVYPSYELYHVDTIGQITQLTHLTEHYPRVYIDDLSWSPDASHIAFWFSFWEDTAVTFNTAATTRLGILDMSTGIVSDYCFTGERGAAVGGARSYPLPLWSPDSNQLVFQSQISGDAFQTVLVDIQLRSAYKLADDLAPVGWIVRP